MLKLLEIAQNDAYTNMALDEAMLTYTKNHNMSVLRFYKFLPTAVSIAKYQNLDDINLEACKDRGIDCVRRPTGGGFVLHKNDLCYAVSVSEKLIDSGDLYRMICNAVASTLQSFGIDAHFVPKYHVAIGDRKICGNAQAIKDEVILQHGYVQYYTDFRTMESIAGKNKNFDISKIRDMTASVRDYTDVSYQTLYEKTRDSIASDFSKKTRISIVSEIGDDINGELMNIAKPLIEKYKKLEPAERNRGPCIMLRD